VLDRCANPSAYRLHLLSRTRCDRCGLSEGGGAFPSDALALLYHDGIAVVTPNFCTGKVDHDGRASGDISGLQFHALAAKEELAVEDRREARKLRQF
jgi:hypothetical protein